MPKRANVNQFIDMQGRTRKYEKLFLIVSSEAMMTMCAASAVRRIPRLVVRLCSQGL